MFTYDPATICAHEMPIWRRACDVDFWRFTGKRTAKDLCIALCGVPDSSVYDFTREEWESIATVANGGMWPVPDSVYTRADWEKNREFNAAPGQEIAEEIYDEMLDVLPPYSLPRCKRTDGFTAGFMVSEPVSTDPVTGKLNYSAFGKRNGKYYFIGLLPSRPNE